MTRRRVRRWLLVGLLVAGLAGAAHWGFHFYVKQRLTQWQAQWAPQLRLRYAGLTTDLRGRIELHRLQLEGEALPGPLRIQRLVLTGPAVWRYLWDSLQLAGRAPPAEVRLRAEGVDLALPEAQPAQACRPRKAPLHALILLGHRRLQGVFEGGYRYDGHRRRLALEATLKLTGRERFSLALQLGNLSPEAFRRGRLDTAALKRLALKLDLPPEVGHRLLAACARIEQLTPVAHAQRMAQGWLEALQSWGVIPDPLLRNALQRYARDFGRLELVLHPPAPLTLAFLPFMPPEQLPDKVGLQLAVNGQFLPGLRLQNDFRLPQPVDESGATPADPRSSRPEAAAPAAPSPRWRYRVVSPSSLPRYVGRKVRLYEAGRPPRQGLLLQVTEEDAAVELRLRKGSLVAHVPLQRLQRVEVWLPATGR